MAKRYDLMSQKSDGKSRSSGRNNQTTTDRVQNWIETQGQADKPDRRIEQPVIPADSVNLLSDNSVDQLIEGLTSTQVNKIKSVGNQTEPCDRRCQMRIQFKQTT